MRHGKHEQHHDRMNGLATKAGRTISRIAQIRYPSLHDRCRRNPHYDYLIPAEPPFQMLAHANKLSGASLSFPDASTVTCINSDVTFDPQQYVSSSSRLSHSKSFFFLFFHINIVTSHLRPAISVSLYRVHIIYYALLQG